MRKRAWRAERLTGDYRDRICGKLHATSVVVQTDRTDGSECGGGGRRSETRDLDVRDRQGLLKREARRRCQQAWRKRARVPSSSPTALTCPIGSSGESHVAPKYIPVLRDPPCPPSPSCNAGARLGFSILAAAGGQLLGIRTGRRERADAHARIAAHPDPALGARPSWRRRMARRRASASGAAFTPILFPSKSSRLVPCWTGGGDSRSWGGRAGGGPGSAPHLGPAVATESRVIIVAV